MKVGQLSNLDITGTRIIRKGAEVIDMYGFRFQCARVRMGSCTVYPINAFGQVFTDKGKLIECKDVRVAR